MVDVNVDNLRQSDLAKLPLYAGDVKDQFTAEQWIERISRSRTASAWTADHTMAFVFNALRGNALRWFDALKRAASTATTGMPLNRRSLLPSAPPGRPVRPPSTSPTSIRVKRSKLFHSTLELSRLSTTLRLSPALLSRSRTLRFRSNSPTSRALLPSRSLSVRPQLKPSLPLAPPQPLTILR
jgi:hypothetical protein